MNAYKKAVNIAKTALIAGAAVASFNFFTPKTATAQEYDKSRMMYSEKFQNTIPMMPLNNASLRKNFSSINILSPSSIEGKMSTFAVKDELGDVKTSTSGEVGLALSTVPGTSMVTGIGVNYSGNHTNLGQLMHRVSATYSVAIAKENYVLLGGVEIPFSGIENLNYDNAKLDMGVSWKDVAIMLRIGTGKKNVIETISLGGEHFRKGEYGISGVLEKSISGDGILRLKVGFDKRLFGRLDPVTLQASLMLDDRIRKGVGQEIFHWGSKDGYVEEKQNWLEIVVGIEKSWRQQFFVTPSLKFGWNSRPNVANQNAPDDTTKFGIGGEIKFRANF